jgi:hypothetical protein
VRFILDVQMPMEPFNTMVKNGTAAQTIEKVMADIKPEAVYFCENNGSRGGFFVVDMPDASHLPAIAEPLSLAFNASINSHVVMLPEDLAKSGLDEIGKKYS